MEIDDSFYSDRYIVDQEELFEHIWINIDNRTANAILCITAVSTRIIDRMDCRFGLLFKFECSMQLK